MEYKHGQDQLTIGQVIEAFPDECRQLIPKVNRVLKKEIKPYLKHCAAIRKKYYDDFTEQFLVQIMGLMYQPDKIKKQIKRNDSILNSINAPEGDKITDLMIEQAKEVPLATLYDFQRIKAGSFRFSACCPFHNEKTGSFTVYKNNTYYCFGCHKGGDTIEFVRKLHGFGFPEAVKFLLNQ